MLTKSQLKIAWLSRQLLHSPEVQQSFKDFKSAAQVLKRVK
jgi:hypothetical protein